MTEILSAEEVVSERYRYPDSTTEDGANDVIALCESHEALRARLAEVEAERDRAWRECSKAQDESSVWFNKRAAAEGRAAKERSGRLAAEARLAEIERIANEMGDGVSPECSGFADQILAVLDKGEPDE